MSNHLRVRAVLVGALLAAPLAAAQPATESTDRDVARGFYAGFVEAREIDARCDLLEPERRVKYADYLEYLRLDTVREFDAGLVAEAEDVGKRYARDPEYLDCGQAAMDRIENRYERIESLVAIDKWKRETPEGRAFAERMERIQEEVEAEMEAEVAAEGSVAESEAPALTEGEQKQAFLAILGVHAQIARAEERCSFLDEATRTRMLALYERVARGLRAKIADPAAVAAVESATDTDAGCGDDLSQQVHRLAEQIDETEAMVEAMEQIDAMVASLDRRQQAAAAADLSVPLPPPPVGRPKPLTRAQKQKAENLEHYADAVRRHRIETRCRFLSEEMHVRLLRTETRYAGLLRLEIGDPAAVDAVDAAPDADMACGESQRGEIDRAVNFLGLTESMIEMMESEHADAAQ